MLDKAFKVGPNMKLSKCSLFKQQNYYLDHLVGKASILLLGNKIEALRKLKPPTNFKVVRHFLSLTGYHQTCICNYVDIMHLLNCLACKSQPFVWTPECQTSFDMLYSDLLIHQ